ncbi:MAG: type II toxin-antitoxin system mRNA interferase toxin, RelE/StbE family [Bacteroidetes bacterium HGW-Bacteroidetes-12]|nr:MAG: type II toxin-antitoxin system mRNA interferase toxin, RelE/StbE family [Bacteroidetes bacterium HGW-Bacteroidetes-12]
MSKSNFIVRLLSIAEEDFTEIISFIAADNLKAAEDLANKIEKNLGLLSQNPLLGKTPSDPDIKILGYRYLIIENYLAFYTIEQRTIFIHRILHGARNYKSLLI